MDQYHIHVDNADHAHSLAMDKHATLVAEGAGVSICIAHGDGGDGHIGLGEKRRTVAYEIASRYFLERHNFTAPFYSPTQGIAMVLGVVQAANQCFFTGPVAVL